MVTGYTGTNAFGKGMELGAGVVASYQEGQNEARKASASLGAKQDTAAKYLADNGLGVSGNKQEGYKYDGVLDGFPAYQTVATENYEKKKQELLDDNLDRNSKDAKALAEAEKDYYDMEVAEGKGVVIGADTKKTKAEGIARKYQGMVSPETFKKNLPLLEAAKDKALSPIESKDIANRFGEGLLGTLYQDFQKEKDPKKAMDIALQYDTIYKKLQMTSTRNPSAIYEKSSVLFAGVKQKEATQATLTKVGNTLDVKISKQVKAYKAKLDKFRTARGKMGGQLSAPEVRTNMQDYAREAYRSADKIFRDGGSLGDDLQLTLRELAEMKVTGTPTKKTSQDAGYVSTEDPTKKITTAEYNKLPRGKQDDYMWADESTGIDETAVDIAAADMARKYINDDDKTLEDLELTARELAIILLKGDEKPTNDRNIKLMMAKINGS